MRKNSEIRGLVGQKNARLFSRLDSPAKIQNFLNALPYNHETSGETYMSPMRMLKEKKAHCFEGALFAAACLMYHGRKPLLLDLRTARGDTDHVVALYRDGAHWGAVSKTNHSVLRYRDPVYASVRELALSYFHEYFLDGGKKTLREYSAPFDLTDFKLESWLTTDENVVDIVNALDDSKHFKIMPPATAKKLRKADAIEIRAQNYEEEWPKRPKKRS